MLRILLKLNFIVIRDVKIEYRTRKVLSWSSIIFLYIRFMSH